MTIYYSLVFYFLILELFLLSVILAPLHVSIRTHILKYTKSIYKSKLSHSAFILISILALDALNRLLPLFNKHSDPHSHSHYSDSEHAKLFYAQRNVYLTFAAVFVHLVLARVIYLLSNIPDPTPQPLSQPTQTSSKDSEILSLRDQISTLEKEIESLNVKIKVLDKDAIDKETILKQAKNQHDAYMGLADRYNALERKLGSGSGGKKVD